MKRSITTILAITLLAAACPASAFKLTEATEACFGCHQTATPGVIEDWHKSRHAAVSPNEALQQPAAQRRLSAKGVVFTLGDVNVGCAECHTINADKHADTFEHNGYRVHTVVTPEDCAVCHPDERAQYDGNLMSHAYANLNDNPVYHDLADQANGTLSYDGGRLILEKPDESTSADSCYFCHGTKVTVTGSKARMTAVGDEMTFPTLSGWPNQGVGRINPDGSRGACTSCHPRHQFSIEVARKPHTCSECHKGPDVPAYAVYTVSKHGNIYESLQKEWNFSNVPWRTGPDFTAPTCAACHVSLLADADGTPINARTHRMNDRGPWRLMGLIYAHPHPASPDTTVIRNKAGLPLPTELTGEPAAAFLIDAAEQRKRRLEMQKVCSACHSLEWVDGAFGRLERTIETTNLQTLAATKIMLDAWEKGVARGLAEKDSLFNEGIEKLWVEQWLFYANSTRYASAMAGADYGAFAKGRWYLNKNLADMKDLLELKLREKK